VPAGSVLTASIVMANIPMPRATTIVVEWYRNASNSNVGGTLIATHTGPIPIANPGQAQTATDTYTTVDADIGNWIYAVAYARNARGTGAPSVVSSTIGAVTAVAPVLSGVTLTGTFSEGNTVFATPNYSTVGHPAPSETYQWQYSTDGSSGWTNIGGATSSSFVIPGVTYAGYFLRCTVSASNTAGSSGPVSSGPSGRVGTLYFGDGRDGDVTLSSTQTIASGKQYRNLTLVNAITVNVGNPGDADALVQICRTLTMNGNTLAADGVAGTSTAAQDGTTDLAGSAGTTGGAGGGGAGGAGGTYHHAGPTYDAGSNGGAPTGAITDGDGGNGTASGTTPPSSGGAGYAGSNASSPTTKAAVQSNSGGWGGGGGGGGAAAYTQCVKGCSYGGGPSAGSGGGFLRVMAAAHSIPGAATLRANGGNGGSTSFNSGGGGGGGRVAFVTYDASMSSNLTMQVNGGTNGATSATAGNTHTLLGTGP
jgi:hypothetical protein